MALNSGIVLISGGIETMKATVYKCDVCGVERKEANHWFLLWIDGHGIIADGFLIKTWNKNEANRDDVRHVCGQEHLNVLISRWIEEEQKKVSTQQPTAPSEWPKPTGRDSLMESIREEGIKYGSKCMICGGGHETDLMCLLKI